MNPELTINLSDIGQSLVAIETAIKSNSSNIKYYEEMIQQMHAKNEALRATANTILHNYCEGLK